MYLSMRERAFVRRRWQKIAGPVQLRDPFVRRLAYPGGKKSYSHAQYLKAAVALGPTELLSGEADR